MEGLAYRPGPIALVNGRGPNGIVPALSAGGCLLRFHGSIGSILVLLGDLGPAGVQSTSCLAKDGVFVRRVVLSKHRHETNGLSDPSRTTSSNAPLRKSGLFQTRHEHVSTSGGGACPRVRKQAREPQDSYTFDIAKGEVRGIRHAIS